MLKRLKMATYQRNPLIIYLYITTTLSASPALLLGFSEHVVGGKSDRTAQVEEWKHPSSDIIIS